jgi:hypothetical protein
MSRRRNEESISIVDHDVVVVDRTPTGSVRVQKRPGPPVVHQP